MGLSDDYTGSGELYRHLVEDDRVLEFQDTVYDDLELVMEAPTDTAVRQVFIDDDTDALVNELDQYFSRITSHTWSSETERYGADTANAVLNAETYPEAEKALDDFADWAEEAAESLVQDGGVLLEDGSDISGDPYRELITLHAMRRLVKWKHDYDRGETEQFSADDGGEMFNIAETSS